jgi:hypothetical protein
LSKVLTSLDPKLETSMVEEEMNLSDLGVASEVPAAGSVSNSSACFE